MPTLTPYSEDVRIYEFCILYPYPMGQKEEATLLKEIDALFAEAGAKQVAKDKWGRRGLAYPIKGATEGNYMVLYVEMEPAKLKELDQALRIHKNILRHMMVIPPKGYVVVQFADKYEEWLKERESVEDTRRRETEERVQASVAKKAQRKAKMAASEKKEPGAKPKLEEGALTEKLDKLISDDSLSNI